MKRRDVVLLAWEALADHGLRASLSAIGVLFGVATIVAALAVGEGARRRAYREVAALGLDNVFIRSRPVSNGYPAPARLAPADVAAVSRASPARVVAAARREDAPLQSASATAAAHVAGVTPAWRDIAEVELAQGRWLDEADVSERRRVIVLAPALARSLFGATAPVGAHVRWRGQWFRVVGVLRPGRRAAHDATAFVPLTSADMRLGANDDVRYAQEIALLARDEGAADAVARAAMEALAGRGHPEAVLDVIVPRALLRARLEAQRTFDWMLLGIGFIAVVISGVGIMNIMLATVTERTNEIGLRRATGARRCDVVAQFATEAVLLCLCGALLGIPAGLGAAGVIAVAAGWPVSVSLGTVALAAGTATLVGLTFGVYPACRAAALDPVVALRA